MGMFSEITTESNIQSFCEEIERELSQPLCAESVRVLKTVGRFALTQFEWTTPKWAAKYSELFKKEM
jgi:hypothetical protein